MAQQGFTAARIVLKTLHSIAVCGWLGGGFAVMVLLELAGSPGDEGQLAPLHLAIRSIDDFLITPAAGTTTITGIILCRVTQRGFMRQHWIAVKLLLTAVLIIFGAWWLAPCLQNLATQEAFNPAGNITAATYRHLWRWGVTAASLQTVALLFLMGLSIIKPGRGNAIRPNKSLPHGRRRNTSFTTGWTALRNNILGHQ